MKTKHWRAPEVNLETLKTGDMPGDKIQIDQSHIFRAEKIFPEVQNWLQQKSSRQIISVYGGSGVGKSEIASLLAFYLEKAGYKNYILSGDNYPHRLPRVNDALRIQIYKKGGREALENYLGSNEEIDFSEVNRIIEQFKEGAEEILLKHMGRTIDSTSRKNQNFHDVQLLIIEWTHGNNPLLKGVDFPVFLYSNPGETLAHRLNRARDEGVDSPFVQMVLDIEQKKLDSSASKAALILSKEGEILPLDFFPVKRNGL